MEEQDTEINKDEILTMYYILFRKGRTDFVPLKVKFHSVDRSYPQQPKKVYVAVGGDSIYYDGCHLVESSSISFDKERIRKFQRKTRLAQNNDFLEQIEENLKLLKDIGAINEPK